MGEQEVDIRIDGKVGRLVSTVVRCTWAVVCAIVDGTIFIVNAQRDIRETKAWVDRNDPIVQRHSIQIAVINNKLHIQ